MLHRRSKAVQLGDVVDDKIVHKRKHDTYAQDDQRQYTEISEDIPHMSEVDMDIGIKPISKQTSGRECAEVTFQEVLWKPQIYSSDQD